MYLKRLTGFLLSILIVSMIMPTMSSAAVVWSDDFQDGDYTGWTVLTGTFSAEEQVLRATGFGEYRNIQHNSSVAYGSWSFDAYHNSSVSIHYGSCYTIMADELVEGEGVYAENMVPRNGYSLDYATLGASFNRWTDGLPSSVGGIPSTFSGWRTINITRDHTGHFEIYINGTLEETLDDNTHTTSAVFGWASKPGHAIDNVIISELESSGIDPLLLGVAGIGIVVVIAIVVFLRRKS